MDDQAREQAFVNAVATEHFVTQAARAAIVAEMTGRAMIYMGAVSSALIAFGFLAPTGDVAPFVAGVLPALLLFGELTFAALLRNTLENIALPRHMQEACRSRSGCSVCMLRSNNVASDDCEGTDRHVRPLVLWRESTSTGTRSSGCSIASRRRRASWA
jgi:hypothetical protein